MRAQKKLSELCYWNTGVYTQELFCGAKKSTRGGGANTAGSSVVSWPSGARIKRGWAAWKEVWSLICVKIQSTDFSAYFSSAIWIKFKFHLQNSCSEQTSVQLTDFSAQTAECKDFSAQISVQGF